MKEYEISVPIMGVAHLTVEAESEAEALQIALGEAGSEHVDEWQGYAKLVEGNVFYGSLSRARVDSCRDLDDGEI